MVCMSTVGGNGGVAGGGGEGGSEEKGGLLKMLPEKMVGGDGTVMEAVSSMASWHALMDKVRTRVLWC